MGWVVEGTDEFSVWYDGLDDAEQASVIAVVDLLLGGNKTGADRWYEIHVPKADAIYDQYLEDLKKEGLL